MIATINFDKSIVVYWQPPTSKKSRYSVFLNGEKTATTEKTHFTIDGLIPSMEYRVAVYGENDLPIGEIATTTKASKKPIDVTKPPYNAVGDGVTLNTSAIQKAFDDCDENSFVYLPKGEYLTGALDMASNKELYLERDAVLVGSANEEDYLPKIKSRFEGIEMLCYRSLINMGSLDSGGGYNCYNVVLRGEGRIVGGGNPLCDRIIERELVENAEEIETQFKEYGTFVSKKVIAGRARGRLINISNAQNVLIYGLSLEQSPSWNVHMIYSDSVVTAKCRFESVGIHNGDGWDPDSSTDCVLFDSVFLVGDDCVAIKSGKNIQGNIINRPSKNIYVFDCFALAGHGCAIGSEMSGGVENVYVWDCNFTDTLCGMHIKTTSKRGGYVRNVKVYNSSFCGIFIETVPYNNDGITADELPVFENFRFEGVTLSGVMVQDKDHTDDCYEIDVNGFAEDPSRFRNITIKKVTRNGCKEGFEYVRICNATDVIYE